MSRRVFGAFDKHGPHIQAFEDMHPDTNRPMILQIKIEFIAIQQLSHASIVGSRLQMNRYLGVHVSADVADGLKETNVGITLPRVFTHRVLNTNSDTTDLDQRGDGHKEALVMEVPMNSAIGCADSCVRF